MEIAKIVLKLRLLRKLIVSKFFMKSHLSHLITFLFSEVKIEIMKYIIDSDINSRKASVIPVNILIDK